MERGDGIAKTENILGSLPDEAEAEKSHKVHTLAPTATAPRLCSPSPGNALKASMFEAQKSSHTHLLLKG